MKRVLWNNYQLSVHAWIRVDCSRCCAPHTTFWYNKKKRTWIVDEEDSLWHTARGNVTGRHGVGAIWLWSRVEKTFKTPRRVSLSHPDLSSWLVKWSQSVKYGPSCLTLCSHWWRNRVRHRHTPKQLNVLYTFARVCTTMMHRLLHRCRRFSDCSLVDPLFPTSFSKQINTEYKFPITHSHRYTPTHQTLARLFLLMVIIRVMMTELWLRLTYWWLMAMLSDSCQPPWLCCQGPP